MKFASLGSGSKGNATLVQDEHSCLLIDCGFSVKETEARLSLLNVNPQDINAILVTHEHSDHIKGVFSLGRKYNIPVYLTAGTLKTLKKKPENVRLIDSYHRFQCASFEVMPVAVPHDAREPVQYVLHSDGLKLGVLTDLGMITGHIIEHYGQCDGLLLEANHDVTLLANGPYPAALKNRVGGDWGHLNNQQARGLLNHVCLSSLQQLVLGHISEQNNSQSHVREAMLNIESAVSSVHYASQNAGFDWLELA